MAAAGEGEDKASSSFDISNVTASAGKLWDNKLGEASKALDEQLSSVVGTASSALDSGLAAASEAVRAGVSSAARETSDIKSRLQQFYDTGVAHYQAAEQQALDGVKRGVWYVRHDHPEASLAGGVALAAVLLPGPRRFLLRQTIGRFRSEEAMYRSAELRYGALKERVEGQTGDLHKLQERLELAEAEYVRGLAKLKSTAGELESLGSRVQSSGKAARGLIDELRQLPSKQALQLRSDAANIAASVSDQHKALDKSLRRVAKQYGI